MIGYEEFSPETVERLKNFHQNTNDKEYRKLVREIKEKDGINPEDHFDAGCQHCIKKMKQKAWQKVVVLQNERKMLSNKRTKRQL